VCATVGVAVPSVSTPEDRACCTCGRASCAYRAWRLAVSVSVSRVTIHRAVQWSWCPLAVTTAPGMRPATATPGATQQWRSPMLSDRPMGSQVAMVPVMENGRRLGARNDLLLAGPHARYPCAALSAGPPRLRCDRRNADDTGDDDEHPGAFRPE
jgi:hypothetical protein